jgi:hypothetical protein
MSALIAFLLSTAGKYAALGLVAFTTLATAYRAAFKAGKNSQLAKENQANEKALSDLARANAARANANTDSVSNDGFRRD